MFYAILCKFIKHKRTIFSWKDPIMGEFNVPICKRCGILLE